MPMTTLEMAKASRLRPGTPGFDAQLARLQAASDAAKRAYLQGGDAEAPGGYDEAVRNLDAARQQGFESQRAAFLAGPGAPLADAPYYPQTRTADTGMGTPGSTYGPRYSVKAGGGLEGVAANEAAHRAAVAAMNPSKAADAAMMALPGSGNDLTWKPETMQTIQNESMVKRLVASGAVPGGGGLSPVERARGIVSEKSRAGKLGGKVGDTWVGPGAVDIVPQAVTGQFETPAGVAGMVAPDVTQLNLSGVPDAGGSPRFQVVQRGPDIATQIRMLGPQAQLGAGEAGVAASNLATAQANAGAAVAPQMAQAAVQSAQAQAAMLHSEAAKGSIIVDSLRTIAAKDPQAVMRMLSNASPAQEAQIMFAAADAMEKRGDLEGAKAARAVGISRATGQPATPEQRSFAMRVLDFLISPAGMAGLTGQSHHAVFAR